MLQLWCMMFHHIPYCLRQTLICHFFTIHITITHSFRLESAVYDLMICNMLGCDTETLTQVMFWHFEDGDRKPTCKQIMRFCINHSKRISQNDHYIRTQLLNWERSTLKSRTRNHDFLSVCINEELSVEGNLKNIIWYPVIPYRNRPKLASSKLTTFPSLIL